MDSLSRPAFVELKALSVTADAREQTQRTSQEDSTQPIPTEHPNTVYLLQVLDKEGKLPGALHKASVALHSQCENECSGGSSNPCSQWDGRAARGSGSPCPSPQGCAG